MPAGFDASPADSSGTVLPSREGSDAAKANASSDPVRIVTENHATGMLTLATPVHHYLVFILILHTPRSQMP